MIVIKLVTKNDFVEIHSIFEEVHELHYKNEKKIFKESDPFTKEEFDCL